MVICFSPVQPTNKLDVELFVRGKVEMSNVASRGQLLKKPYPIDRRLVRGARSMEVSSAQFVTKPSFILVTLDRGDISMVVRRGHCAIK